MKIIILEGIATSGKTSIKKELIKILDKNKKKIEVVDEHITLMPILENTDKNISISFLKEILNENLHKKLDYLIFDRLYFTHIFRTKSSLDEFSEIEDLLKNNSLLIFLKVDNDKIPQRIEYARKNRDQKWNQYVSKKGTDKEIYEYYIKQQEELLDLVEQTKLRKTIYDTSNLNFDEIADDILND